MLIFNFFLNFPTKFSTLVPQLVVEFVSTKQDGCVCAFTGLFSVDIGMQCYLMQQQELTSDLF